MSVVSIRELRNHGGDVVDRVAKGESITITRNGRAVAELRPIRREPALRDALIARRRSLPPVDPAVLRQQIDELIDGSL